MPWPASSRADRRSSLSAAHGVMATQSMSDPQHPTKFDLINREKSRAYMAGAIQWHTSALLWLGVVDGVPGAFDA
eukprot:4682904-Amphidinium_carterae.1